MSWIKLFFNEIFYLPILNALLFLTSILPGHDLGLAVILLTVLIRALIFPMTHKMLKTQNAMKKIEPELKKIYAEKKNKEEQGRAVMELYRAHGINPFSGFLMLIIQLPLLIAMYRVFWRGIPFQVNEIYPFLTIPVEVNTLFLGFISLTSASVGLAALAALSQFWQAKLAMPPAQNNKEKGKQDMSRAMQLQMVYVFPILIFILGFKLPAAVSLYWTSMNIFAIVHETIVRRSASRQTAESSSYAGGTQRTN